MSFFPIMFAISVLAALLWLAWTAPDDAELEELGHAMPLRARIDASLWALLGGFLSARIAFVLAHLGYYAAHPLEILQTWMGGLSWVGAVAGALLALFLYALVTKRSFWDLADLLAPPVGLIATALWIGCLIDGSVYGIGGQTGALAIEWPDVFGVVSRRWPTQAVGAGCSALITFAAFLLRARLPRSGMLASMTLALIALMMLALSFTRGDVVGLLLGIRLDLMGSAAVLAVSLTGLALRFWRK